MPRFFRAWRGVIALAVLLIGCLLYTSAGNGKKRSDFEPVFATDEAIAPLLDSLLEQSRRDERLHSLLEEACRNVFFHSPQRGFLAGETLRERVMELLLPIMGTQSVTLAHQMCIRDRPSSMSHPATCAAFPLERTSTVTSPHGRRETTS